jgi:hypothetical protein
MSCFRFHPESWAERLLGSLPVVFGICTTDVRERPARVAASRVGGTSASGVVRQSQAGETPSAGQSKWNHARPGGHVALYYVDQVAEIRYLIPFSLD